MSESTTKTNEPTVEFARPRKAYTPKNVTAAAARKAEDRPTTDQLPREPIFDTTGPEWQVRVEDVNPDPLRTDAHGVRLDVDTDTPPVGE